MRKKAVTYYIGLDIGTSSAKAVAYDAAGRAKARAVAKYETQRSSIGVAEQQADDWWIASCAVLSEVMQVLGEGVQLSVGLSGQIGTHVLLDSASQPLAPAMTWQDGRSASSLRALADISADVVLAGQLDHHLPAGPAWPVPRLMHLKSGYPELWRRAAAVAQPKDYVLQRLTGSLRTDSSSWRGAARQSDGRLAPVLDDLGISGVIPERLLPNELAGRVTPVASAQCDLPAGTPVFTGWNDLNASLLGGGIVEQGQRFDVGGTSEHVGVVTALAATPETLVRIPYLPPGIDPLVITYGVSSNGGAVTEWLRRVFYLSEPDEIFHRLIEADVSSVPVGSDGVLALPYLNGERAPVWNPSAVGALVGLRASHGRAHITRANLEGVALNLRQIIELIGDSGEQPQMRSTGGTSRMRAWNQIKADVFGSTILTLEEVDTSCLGAAMLAAMGEGTFPNALAAAAAMVRTREEIFPNASATAAYRALAPKFAGLYPAISQLLQADKE